MPSRHHISAAEQLFYGAAAKTRHMALYDGRRGHVAHVPYYHDFGAPLAALATGLVAGATGAELPNNATITYTPATDGVSPLDDAGRPAVNAAYIPESGVAGSVYPIATPRAVQMVVTHASSIVALSCLVSGFDVYGQPMSELLAVTATGTSKTASGKKAFAFVSSIAFTSAGNATTDTANLGWIDVLGFPYKITQRERAILFGNNVLDTSATFVAAVATDPATTTTGDVRGTFAPSSATDATKRYAAWLIPTDPSTVAGLFGVTQA